MKDNVKFKQKKSKIKRKKYIMVEYLSVFNLTYKHFQMLIGVKFLYLSILITFFLTSIHKQGSTNISFKMLYLCRIHIVFVLYWLFYVIIFEKLLVPLCARTRTRTHVCVHAS